MTTKQLIRKCPNLVNFIVRNYGSVETKIHKKLDITISIDNFLCKFNKNLPKSIYVDLIKLYLSFIKTQQVEFNNDILMHDFKLIHNINETQQLKAEWLDNILDRIENIVNVNSSGLFYLIIIRAIGIQSENANAFNYTTISYDSYCNAYREMISILLKTKVNDILQNI